MRLTPRQKEVLRTIYSFRNREVIWAGFYKDLTGWVRPKDIGGVDGSYHSRVLRQLEAKGLVLKSPRNEYDCSYRYKITKAGIEVAEGEDRSDTVC